jgi:hypothetical protein
VVSDKQVDAFDKLTERQREIVSRAAVGQVDTEIAEGMTISRGLVRAELQRIYDKLEIAGAAPRPKSLLGAIYAAATERLDESGDHTLGHRVQTPRAPSSQPLATREHRLPEANEGSGARLFVHLPDYFASPSGRALLYEAEWIGGVTWEDIVDGRAYRRPEVDFVHTIVSKDRAALLI